MGFLPNIDGTLRSIFGIGNKNNRVNIRNNSGILEGSDNGGSYLPILNIDDNVTTTNKTWSSSKINSMIPSQMGSQVLAKNTSTQAIQGGVYTRVLFPTEVTDLESEFSNSIFTSASTQTILISPVVTITGMGNDRVLYLHIYKNGTSFVQTSNTSGAGGTSGIVGTHLSFPIDVVANDTIEIYTYHNDGSNNRNLNGTQMLSIIKMR